MCWSLNVLFSTLRVGRLIGNFVPLANIVTALGLDGDLVNRDNFPLPTVSTKLDKIRMDLHHGRGFGLVRGLNPKKYSVEDLTVLQLGIQCYIASNFGRQDKKGNMLGKSIADVRNHCRP